MSPCPFPTTITITPWALHIYVYNLPKQRLSISNDNQSNKKMVSLKARSILYPEETMTDADNTDHLALLANTPSQDEFALIILEQAPKSIGLYENTNKIEFMCFN